MGSEILFILFLGSLVLGPKQLHSLLGHVALVKAKFDEASRGFKSQLAKEIETPHHASDTDVSQESRQDQ